MVPALLVTYKGWERGGATGGSGGLGAGPHEGELMSSGRLWAWT